MGIQKSLRSFYALSRQWNISWRPDWLTQYPAPPPHWLNFSWRPPASASRSDCCGWVRSDSAQRPALLFAVPPARTESEFNLKFSLIIKHLYGGSRIQRIRSILQDPNSNFFFFGEEPNSNHVDIKK